MTAQSGLPYEGFPFPPPADKGEDRRKASRLPDPGYVELELQVRACALLSGRVGDLQSYPYHVYDGDQRDQT